MQFRSPFIISVALLIAQGSLSAEDYLTKDGNLAQQLKVVELQGSFAGNTGTQFTVSPDGSWTLESIFNQMVTLKDKGKLPPKELAELAGILEKYELVKLPADSGKPPGSNPRTITFEFGKQKASLVGQTPPKLDPMSPAGTVESRFAGIIEGVRSLLVLPKDGAVAKGEVGKLLPIPDEFKEVQVIAYFTLERPEGKLVEKAKTVSVTVYKDAKIERRAGGKRIPIKAGDIKPGQRIELHDLAEGVQIGDSMRIAASSIIVEEQGK